MTADRLARHTMRTLAETAEETAARVFAERNVLQDQLEAAMRALAFLADPYARQQLRVIRQHLAAAGIEVQA